MTAIVLPNSADSQPGGRGGIRLAVATALTVWLLLVLSFGAAGAFIGLPGTPPLAIAIGIAAPLIVFFASLRLWQSFREFVLNLDLRLIAGMQAWRWAGLGFLSLYTYKVLPAVFALRPLGWGTWPSESRPHGLCLLWRVSLALPRAAHSSDGISWGYWTSPSPSASRP